MSTTNAHCLPLTDTAAPTPPPCLQGENYDNRSYPQLSSGKATGKSDEPEHLYTNLEFGRDQVCVCMRTCVCVRGRGVEPLASCSCAQL